jgi:hypothetical protein
MWRHGAEKTMILHALESRSCPARLIAADGVVYADSGAFRPFTDYRGPLNVALAGDVNGDGAEDIVIGAGAGGGPRVVVLDPRTGERFGDWFAFESSFRGGVTVAVDDDTLLLGSGPGGAPVVAEYDLDTLTETRRNLYGSADSRGGVTLDGNAGTRRDPAISLGVGPLAIYLDLRSLQPFEQSAVARGVFDRFAPLADLLTVTNVRPVGYPSNYVTAHIADLDYFPIAVDGIATNTLRNRQPDSFHSIDVYADESLTVDRLITTLTHEIGHAFEMAHSDDPANNMNAPAPVGGRFDAGQFAEIREYLIRWGV